MDELEDIRKNRIKKFLERISKKEGSKKERIMITVDDKTFEEGVIEQSKKSNVVVDFWAQWCAPCLILSPVLERLADEYNGKFVLAKINVSENPITTQRYGIRSIPCVKMFKNGKVIDEFIGAVPEQFVREWLDKNIK